MKKVFSILMVLLICMFVFTGCSFEDDNQGTSSVAGGGSKSNLGDYNVVIKSCRLAIDYEGKDIVIVRYDFTNNSDESASFMFSIEANVYQNDIGLNESYFVDDSANYSSDNQTKNIKKGATLSVEVAYELNDATTDIVVEVKEWISWSDKTVTKTFKIS